MPVDQPRDAVDRGALETAEERPQELPPVPPVGLEVAGDPAEHAHQLARPLVGLQVGHPRPDVGLHDVRRDDRALHVEDGNDRFFALADLHDRLLAIAARQLAQRLRDRR